MDINLQKSGISNQQSLIKITGSKSETNRLLLLQALYPEIIIENASNSDDSEVMLKILRDFNANNGVPPSRVRGIFDVHHAGTAMRFLTAFFAIQEGKEVVLTGSSRMKERPIKILVDVLRQLGADIEYVENEGFPPLKIKGKKIIQDKVVISANVSSQYISALLLIAPKLENGLELTLEGEITSVSYIKMTLALLDGIGVSTNFENKTVIVAHRSNAQAKLSPSFGGVGEASVLVESDWSSASYWYSIVALSAIGTEITLSSYKENSLQGDSVLATIYKDFGVETVFNNNNSITISKISFCNQKSLICNLNSSPDIAQTIAVTCLGLGINCDLTGLHTLKIKETDRLQALKNEIEKFGVSVTIDDDSLRLVSPPKGELEEAVSIATYQDHRMAMAFTPLALKTNLYIEEAEVVSKSYPTFWSDLKQVGFQISEGVQ